MSICIDDSLLAAELDNFADDNDISAHV